MSEALIIKCRTCKQSFRRDEIGNDPVVLTCRCDNLTVEVRDNEDEEKNLFLVKYKQEKPIIKMRE